MGEAVYKGISLVNLWSDNLFGETCRFDLFCTFLATDFVLFGNK